MTIRNPPPFLAAAAIVVAGAAAYHGSFAGPFVYDDFRSIVDNPTLRHLSLRALLPPGPNLTVSGRPVLNFSLALSHALSGTDVWGYHAVNLAIHLLAGLALFGIARRTLEICRIAEATWLAFAVSLLWTLHPLQTESVLYIVQRAESLMGLFYLLTLYLFIRGAGTAADFRSSIWLSLSWLACLLGAGTKEVMVSAPVIVFLYDRCFLAGSFRAAWQRRKTYYLALASTWLLLAALVASTGGDRGGTTAVSAVAWKYWLTQPEAIAHYLRLAVWPHPLVFDYGPFWVAGPGEVLPSLLLVGGLAAASLYALVRRPRAGFLGACFFAILAPTSLVPGTIQMIAEHRMYLALAPILAAAVLAARWIARPFGGATMVSLCLVPAAIGGYLTERRVPVYRSDYALWADTAAKRPNNAFAQNNLGRALFAAGRPDLAEIHYRRALALAPDDPQARYNLANIEAEDGRLDAAIADYREALRLAPDDYETHNNLGIALRKAGRTLPAIGEFEATVRLRPDSFEGHCNLADALADVGRLDESASEYGRALAIRPSSALARENLGFVLAREDRLDQAVAQFEEAAKLDPSDPELRANLELARRHLGR